MGFASISHTKVTDLETHLSGLIFDVSEANNGTSYESLSDALSVANDVLLPEQKKGGMSIKYVQSSDNKYVQFRYMLEYANTTAGNAAFVNVANWQGVDDEPTAGSENLVKSGGVAAVNGSYAYHPEFIRVLTDGNDKLIIGVKNDGSVYYGAGIPQQVKDYIAAQIEALSLDEYEDIVNFLGSLIEGEDTLSTILSRINEKIEEVGEYGYNSEWVRVITDSDSRIIEGIKGNGTKVVNSDVELNGDVIDTSRFKISPEYNPNFAEVKIDDRGRIIEGTTSDGKKVIGEFANDTKVSIGKFGDIHIAELNSEFEYPGTASITGTKGDPDAAYAFSLHLDDKAFNIRFRFRITENLLNQNKSAAIAKLGSSTLLTASPLPLYQMTSTQVYEGSTKTNYWPCLGGGVRLGANTSIKTFNNIGNVAFSVKYIGEGTEVSIENTGYALVLKEGENVHTLDFETYSTVPELYEAIKLLPGFAVDYRELNNRSCKDIAIFPECNLKPTMYTGVTGQSGAVITEYVDAAEFMIPYAVDETWHTVEVVKINGNIYSVCDGNVVKTIVETNLNDIVLTLGGECGVVFKELSISPNTIGDAEYVDGLVISSFNPYIIIYEGHGMDKVPSHKAKTTDNMNTTIDRLQYVFSLLKNKGYKPVSITDVAEYYKGNIILPKRCYTLIFDDFRFDNVLDLDNRSVFTRFGVKPALAVISSRSEDRFNVTITSDSEPSGTPLSTEPVTEEGVWNRSDGHLSPFSNLPASVGEQIVYSYGSNSVYTIYTIQKVGNKTDIYYNGVVISEGLASDIANRYGFDLVSHTRNHRANDAVKPSEMLSELKKDIYNGDLFDIHSDILVFPYGRTTPYLFWAMNWLGYSLGINVWGGSYDQFNTASRFKYNLTRFEIGMRASLSEVIQGIK